MQNSILVCENQVLKDENQKLEERFVNFTVRLEHLLEEMKWEFSQKDTMVQGVVEEKIEVPDDDDNQDQLPGENMKIFEPGVEDSNVTYDENVERQPKKTVKQPQSNKRKQTKKDQDRQLQAELEQFEQKVMEQEQDDEQSKETDVNQPLEDEVDMEVPQDDDPLFHEKTELIEQDEEIENEHTNKIQIGLGLKFEQDFTELNPGFKVRLLRSTPVSPVAEKKKFQCTECDHFSYSYSTLKRHKGFVHEGINHPCPDCEYTAATGHQLKHHIRSKHEGIKYPCDMCDYKATKEYDLKIHIEMKHLKIRHPCDVCSYSAISVSCLRRHIAKAHEGLRFPCDQCDHYATEKYSLKLHKRRMHNISF